MPPPLPMSTRRRSRTGLQRLEQWHGCRERIEEVFGLDIGRIGDAREVHALVALAQHGAELIELRELSQRELDAQRTRAIGQRAHETPLGRGQ